MLNEDHGVRLSLLHRTMCLEYGLRVDDEMIFHPVGEDGWSYRAGPYWVSVRRDYQGHNPAAYEAAGELRDAGLDFIVPPVRGADGNMVRTVSGFPVVVYPFVAAPPVSGGPYLSRAEQAELLDKLTAVHRSSLTAHLPVEDFRLPFETALRTSMDAMWERDHGAGPFTRAAHALILDARAAIERDLDETAALGDGLRTACQAPAVTHGDVSAANVLRGDGGLLIVDWGGARHGPAERDLFGLSRIVRCTADLPARTDFLRFYSRRWRLAEIAEYLDRFSGPHPDDHDSHAMWSRLTAEVDTYRADR